MCKRLPRVRQPFLLPHLLPKITTAPNTHQQRPVWSVIALRKKAYEKDHRCIRRAEILREHP